MKQNSFNTINSAYNFIKKELNTLYPDNEILSFINIIFRHLLDYSKTDIIHTKLSKSISLQIQEIVFQLKKYKPIQYIIGKTGFFDLEFKVSPAVMIPRPETEELVQWIIQETNNNPEVHILDIGTGSGCIAIALAKNLGNSTVDAVDISEKALKIAKQNALDNNVNINFTQLNILNREQHHFINRKPRRISIQQGKSKYDIIVSNPPYVLEKDKQLMQQNVLNYEPKIALFVSNTEPLIFYEAIADFAIKHLKKNGKLYLEINEFLSKKIENLLYKKSFSNITIIKDLNGKDRMVCGST